MDIQKLKDKKNIYVSCDLLNAGQGIDGAVNVASLKTEYSSTANTYFTSNIIFNEIKNEYSLEGISENQNSMIFIEEDMFKNEKIWIKEGEYSNYIMEKLKNKEVLSLSLKEDILNAGIENYYKNEHLNLSLLNGLSKEVKKSIYSNISAEKMLNEFINITEKYEFKVLFSSSQHVQISFSENDLLEMKDKFQQRMLSSLKTKQLLSEKSSSLNDLIVDSSPVKMKKNRPL